MRRLERHRPLQLLQGAGGQPVVEGPAAFIEQQDGEMISGRGVIRVGGNLGFESLSRPSVPVQRQTGLISSDRIGSLRTGLPVAAKMEIVSEIIGRTSELCGKNQVGAEAESVGGVPGTEGADVVKAGGALLWF
jgi:hypothetical protein